MTATNQQMTSEQLADLSTLAVQLQAKAEANDDRDTAVMAYAVQKACAELIESRREFTAANANIHNLELKVAQVVAENDRAVKAVTVFSNVTHDITEIICDELGQERVAEIVAAYNDIGNMPATDAYLAEVRLQARNEGINYAASRLAAAFNHGFVDKPLAEVYDVVRMILTTKEDLANDPPADGLSGEYAEKSLVEFAAQLRQGAEK
ncbi:hypothetical protein [Kluyvera ascorbata]|uniref:hypothetical protein n=1 Tax=Kluyvera ascorbata TaxID=51288 RepID=UPI0039F6F6F6